MAVGDHTAAGFGRDPAAGRLLGVGAAGAAVAVGLGVYASVHDPPGDLAITLGFSAPISMKVWLATASVGFAVVQLITALWMYGRLPVREAPAGLGSVHRISGRLAFLASLPVAYHCLYQLGFQDSTARVLVHSLLGCAFYGAFVTKVLVVRSHRLPGIALPIAGGLTFMLLVGVWLTSAFWYATDTGFPSP